MGSKAQSPPTLPLSAPCLQCPLSFFDFGTQATSGPFVGLGAPPEVPPQGTTQQPATSVAYRYARPTHAPLAGSPPVTDTNSSQQHKRRRIINKPLPTRVNPTPLTSTQPAVDVSQPQPTQHQTRHALQPNPQQHSSQATLPKRKKPRLSNKPLSAISHEPADHHELPEANCPFMLGYKGALWNSQALLAAAPDKAASKQNTAWRLLNNADFVGLAETHSTEGHVKSLNTPRHTKFFWSHYGTRWQAGVGIGVKHDFLKLFNPTTEDSLQHIYGGRAAKLSLKGPNGNLDIIVVCGRANLEDREERRRMYENIGAKIAPADTTLTIIMGDFNFVTEEKDRWSTDSGTWSGKKDELDAGHWDQHVNSPNKLHDMYQPEPTCTTTEANTEDHQALVLSRIDRVYHNHHITDQLDHNFAITALPFNEDSAHRPLTFSKSGRQKPKEHSPFPAIQLKHPDWEKRLQEKYATLHNAQGIQVNPMEDLKILKKAMWDTAKTLARETGTNLAKSDRDKLGCTMAFLRAAEKVNIKGMTKACALYPTLRALANEGDPNTRVSPNMSKIREHAAELAKSSVKDELLQLSQEQENTSDHEYQQKKTQILTKLKRLIPGSSSSSIGAIQIDDHLATTAEDIAQQLQKHWGRTFNQPPPDTDMLHKWLETLPKLKGDNENQEREVTPRPSKKPRTTHQAQAQHRQRRMEYQEKRHHGGH